MEHQTEAVNYQIGDRVMYPANGRPGYSTLHYDGVGRIESWRGGPAGYRVCMIQPEGRVVRDSSVLRLENEIKLA
jgi:hypothetical protein